MTHGLLRKKNLYRLKLKAESQASKWVWTWINRQKRIQKWADIVQSVSHTEQGFQFLCKQSLSEWVRLRPYPVTWDDSHC
jgi:hypothetical protein